MTVKKLGRPRLPATALECVFQAEGISRRDIAEATGYGYNYVSAILRGSKPINGRFYGKVVLRWPVLAVYLAEHVKEAQS